MIFEDNKILVVDKPPNWVVNDASTTSKANVIQTWLKDRDYPLSKSFEERSGIVHRLDKDTSGVLVVAKTKESFEELQREFKERKVKKVYVGLCHGVFKENVGKVVAPIGRLPWNRERFGVFPGGRDSETDFEVKGSYIKDKERFSLVSFYPKTGRTHQIRVHAKYLGHPIVSDSFYAGRKTAKKDRGWCPRLFLHAREISFIHPETGIKVNFKSELPNDLRVSLGMLEKVG